MLVLRWRPDFSEKSVPTRGVRRKPIRWKSSALGVSSCCAALRGLLGFSGVNEWHGRHQSVVLHTSKPGRDWVDPDVHCPSMCQLLNVNLGADSPCRFPDLRDLQRSRHVLFLPSWKEITAGYRQFLLGAVWILSSTEHFILLNQLSSEAGPPRLLRVVLRRLIRLEGVLRNVGQSADVPSIAPLRTSKPVIGHPDCAGSVRPRPRRQDKPHPVCTDRTFSR